MSRTANDKRPRRATIRPPDTDDLIEFTEAPAASPAAPRREGGYTVIGPEDEAPATAPSITSTPVTASGSGPTHVGSPPDQPAATPPPSNGPVSSQHIENRIQQVIEGLEGLEHLSELVSLRYNPFLEVGENDVFDGQHIQPKDLVQGYFKPGAEMGAAQTQQEQEYPDFMEVARVPRRFDADELDESLDLTDLPINEIHEAVGVPQPGPVMEDEPEVPDGPDLAPTMMPEPTEAPRDHARQTLLVLAWFRRLQESGPAPCIYLFMDHCYRLGWIDEATYDWLCAIAEGVVGRDPELTWEGLNIDPTGLVNLHEANLLFLDDLFTDRLRLGERRYLSRHIHEYFGAA